jgi:methionine--tRNA ligase beta chain
MKGDDEHRRIAVVRSALEAVYAFAHFLAPVLPLASQEIFENLHTTPRASFNLRNDFYNLIPGTPIKLGDILFKKIALPEDSVEVQAAAAVGAGKSSTLPAAKAGSASKSAAAPLSPPPVCGDDLPHASDFTKMSLIVGRIVKVWPHPTAERLYCEQIDMGNGEMREVASGLRQFYSEEQLLNRLVVVVTNLKESKFQGFMSYGMVLAAKSSDGTTVELLEPAVGSTVGERVVACSRDTVAVEYAAAALAAPLPFSAAKVKKAKVWDTVGLHLRVDEAGTACWHENDVLCTAAGKCTVQTLRSAPVS